MRRSLLIILLTIITNYSVAFGQMDDIYNVPVEQRMVIPMGSVRSSEVNRGYNSLARAKFLRDSLRQARNTLSLSGGVAGSLSSMNDPWIEASGGDNTIAITASFDLEHKFSYKRFEITNKIATRFGYNRINIEVTDDEGNTTEEPAWFKNIDEITLSSAPSIKITDNWSYGATASFRSQFAGGYVSRSQQEDIHLKSSFLSPGYLDISGGMIYNITNEKFPIKFTFSPLAMSAIYVTNSDVMQNTLYQYKEHIDDNYKYSEPYSVDPLLTSKYEGGSSLQIDFQRYLDKREMIEFTTMIYSFYGWITELTAKNVYYDYDEYETAIEEWNSTNDGVKPSLSTLPTVRWENTLKINATRLLATTINFKLYYNRSIDRKVQTQTLLDVGLIYTFKN